MVEEGSPAGAARGLAEARVDFHCHTSASFDAVADPAALVVRARDRGLTHIAITDHDTIEGALRAADAAPEGITVIVGSEVLTQEGDLVFLFLREALPTGLPAREAIAEGRAQGALVGIPHPFDRSRRSLLRDPANAVLVPLVDWVEVSNGRNARLEVDRQAGELAVRTGTPGVAASDSHTMLEVAARYTVLRGDLSAPAGLLEALRGEIGLVGSPVEPTSSGLLRGLRNRMSGRGAEA